MHGLIRHPPIGRTTGHAPQPVFCAGIYSSGSTWAFNVVAELLKRNLVGVRSGPIGLAGFYVERVLTAAHELGRRSGGERSRPQVLVQFYADKLENFPAETDAASILVIKTHIPSQALQAYGRLTRAPIILTIRDPRDAVASLMQRFGKSFESASEEVARSAKEILSLSHSPNMFLLRYEDRFFDRPETIANVATVLGCRPSRKTIHAIWQSLTPEQVKAKIEALREEGAFGSDGKPNQFDPETQWHRGHVGETTSGRFAEILSIDQAVEVVSMAEEFCREFGYPVDISEKIYGVPLHSWFRRCRAGDTIEFKKNSDSRRFLKTGWYRMEPNSVWSAGAVSEIEICVLDLPEGDDLTLRFSLSPSLTPRVSSQRLGVTVNRERLWNGEIRGPTTLDITVPRDVLGRQSQTLITLDHPDAVRPGEHFPDRSDNRELAIRLRSLVLIATRQI